MQPIPVYTIAAYSGTGKTTYLEHLIPALRARGLRVAIVKHDAHEFDMDREGKDSWRFTRAGAEVTAVVSGTKAAWIESRPLELDEVLSRIRDVDLILTEGYKTGPWPKIGLCRQGAGKGLAIPLENCAAVVSDVPLDAPCPVFPLDDPGPLADWLAGRIQAG